MRSSVGLSVSLVSASLMAAIVGASAGARAQASDAPITWDVPCGEAAAFVAGVGELGGSFDGFEVVVAVDAPEAGSFRGRLSIRRDGESLVDRELSDERCEDVVDALVIAAALALRSLPREAIEPEALPRETIAPEEATPTPLPSEVVAPPSEVVAPAPPVQTPTSDGSVRVALGASLRVGLGPTPGLALAPDVALALEVERVIVALHFAYWPEAGATMPDETRGVALWAMTSTLEVGYRIGDELGVAPFAVLEPSVALARGVGVERPREEATLVLDGGVAVALMLDLDRVRLFVRADVLFGLVRPVYGVEGEAVFAGPSIRGTGGAGLLVFL